ncbi:MAG: hydroxymethylbilane synthase [Alphaproteobacteria bacterium]|nr:hydroxymethylbilane synthase [Alphaproteobacteria bacterium]
MKKIVRLGTRGSPLALIQAEIVRHLLLKNHPDAQDSFEIEIVPIRTTGDWKPEHKEKTFLEMGGTKGLFTKEIEEALLSDVIDMAVHSMKDVSVHVPDGLMFAAILEREDPRDALLSPVAPRLEELPKGARVGTASLRRKAQVLAIRPDLVVVPLRGNVDTRLKKLADEEADATILALAGLKRLGVEAKAASVFDPSQMLPAAAQGFLGIQIRANDDEAAAWAKAVNHKESELCCLAERALLRALDGSCRTPIGAMATIDPKTPQKIRLEALVATKDGSRIVRRVKEGETAEPETLGLTLGQAMKAELPANFFEL